MVFSFVALAMFAGNAAIGGRCPPVGEVVLEFAQGAVFDLADAFAGQADPVADFPQGQRLIILQAEPQAELSAP